MSARRSKSSARASSRSRPSGGVRGQGGGKSTLETTGRPAGGESVVGPCVAYVGEYTQPDQASNESARPGGRRVRASFSAHLAASVSLREVPMRYARRLASRRAGRPKDPLPVASVGVADPSQAQDDRHAGTSGKHLARASSRCPLVLTKGCARSTSIASGPRSLRTSGK
jgi:hypothetical protein